MIYIEEEERDRAIDAYIAEAKAIGATVEIARVERDFRPNQYDRLAADALALCLRISTALAPRTAPRTAPNAKDHRAAASAERDEQFRLGQHAHVARIAASTELAEAKALLVEARPYLATGNMFRQDDDECDLCHRIDKAIVAAGGTTNQHAPSAQNAS